MVMSRILEKNGYSVGKLDVVAEMGSTEAVRQSIKAGVGVSILSRHAVEEDLKNGLLKAVAIRGVSFPRPFYLIQRKNRQVSPVCTAFLDHVRAGNSLEKEDPG